MANVARAHLLNYDGLGLNKKKREPEESHLVWALKTTSAEDINKVESEAGLLWTNVSPFARLAFSKQRLLQHFGALCCGSMLMSGALQILL